MLKKGCILQSKGGHFDKICHHATHSKVIFSSASRGTARLYTSNLFPMPMYRHR